MIDNDTIMRLSLRNRRVSMRTLGRLSESAERRKTFSAALQQFEEQMTAARAVSPVTRPLNLYYALAQAGMAIAAAHAENPWSFSRHGLKIVDQRPELRNIHVRPDGHGAFQAVASATRSPAITTPVSIDAVWASIPDLSGTGLSLHGSKAPYSLYFVADDSVTFQSPFRNFGTSRYTDSTYTINVTSQPSLAPQGSLVVDGRAPSTDEGRAAWFSRLINSYPGADGASLNGETAFLSGAERFNVKIRWNEAAQTEAWTTEKLDEFFDSRAPKYIRRADRYLRPSVEGNGIMPPSPLMCWWLLLYTFSMLARYRPQNWVELLDCDRSHDAVAIEYATEAALSVIPHLVLEALDGTQHLV